jgi:putative flavoprotein involved in K+ transport
MGVFARTLDEHPRPTAAWREPSLQLSGRLGGRNVDLSALQSRGVTLTGRLTDVDGPRVRLAENLAATTTAADERLRGLLSRIDSFAERSGITAKAYHAEPIRAARVTGSLAEVDLVRAGIRVIIWATGYRRAYPWLHVPVLDEAGDVRHVNGTTASPGLHVVGRRWQTRRSSTFLDGVRHDAAMVVSKILADLGAPATSVRSAA